jgi:anti-sigma factor RsiW
MPDRARHCAFAAVAAALCLVVAGPALAADDKAKSTQSEGKLVKYDAATSTVTIKITKEGKGATPAKGLEVKKGRDAAFRVQPTGSVLARTSVAINGKKGEITDIPEGKTVLVYWVQDEKDPKNRFARKIDVILSDEELDAKYGVDKIEE